MTTIGLRLSFDDDLKRLIWRVVGLVTALVTVGLVVWAINDDWEKFVETSLKGLALGALYAILALGFVLIYKASQVINFAQGSLAMVGGLFLSFLVVDEKLPLLPFDNPLANLGSERLAWFVAVAMALMFAAILGLIIERIAIRPMIGKPIFSVAVITLGLEIILRVFAFDSVKVQTRAIAAPWGADGFKIGDKTIFWSYIALYIATALSFLAVYLFYRSRLGVAMRAVSYDQEAGMAQGIPVGRVFAVAWGAGAALAALGGIFAVQPPVNQQGAVTQETAFIAFRALPAVVLGGLDSVIGALVGGLIIGLAEVYAGQYLSPWQEQLGPGYSTIVPYVVMLAVLLVRPYGLFGQEEIRRV